MTKICWSIFPLRKTRFLLPSCVLIHAKLKITVVILLPMSPIKFGIFENHKPVRKNNQKSTSIDTRTNESACSAKPISTRIINLLQIYCRYWDSCQTRAALKTSLNMKSPKNIILKKLARKNHRVFLVFDFYRSYLKYRQS